METKSKLSRFLMIAILTISSVGMNAQNLQKDKALGKAYSEYVEGMVGTYNNEELRAYIQLVGNRLEAEMDNPRFQFKYTILPMAEPNAFSIPGGHLYITTGMFPFLESEDELACIMAHEIIHANNRHVIKSQRRGILPAILQIPGSIVGAVIDEDIGNALASPFRQLGALTHASYSRKQETEADLEGIEIAARAGYDPNALKTILERIGKYEELVTGKDEEVDRFSTHPLTADRVERIDESMKTLSVVDRKEISPDFIKEFDGVLAGTDPSSGVIEDSTFYHPNKNFKMTFPKNWEVAFMGNLIAGGSKEEMELMQISFKESEADPDSIASQFINSMKSYGNSAMIGSEPIIVNGKKGHLIGYKETYNDTTYYGFRMWLRQNDLLFQFLAISTSEDQSEMQDIIYTLDELNDDDRNSVMANVIRFIKPKVGETITKLVERTNAVSDKSFTGLINQLSEEEVVPEDKLVKVVVSEKYLTK